MTVKRTGPPPAVRVHPKTLVNPHMAALLCWVAVTTAAKGVARIAITRAIIERAERLTMAGAPAEAKPLVKRRHKQIIKAFGPIGLLDPARPKWRGPNRETLTQPGDYEAVRGARENRDAIIVTPTPATLSR